MKYLAWLAAGVLALERSRQEQALLDDLPWCSYVFLWPPGSLESYDVGRAADSRKNAPLAALACNKDTRKCRRALCGLVSLSKWHLEQHEWS